MFNGIVEETGVVERVTRKKNLSVLKVRARKVLKGTKVGDSIAVDGVCLTVTAAGKGAMTFDLMRETLLSTSLGKVKPGGKVNLERALKTGGRVSGHFVTGHVDVVSRVKEVLSRPNYVELVVHLPRHLSRYIVPKGSVCLDGVSLTVGGVRKDAFSVYLIPLTRRLTTLGARKKGDWVNLETDILAKYINGGCHARS
ncbi:MAG: riboflavin synthase [Candidatus Omnitrophica bacterium]|nr:riboflavin synthase [Candidatus Omnitrophota bacterium]